MRSIGCGEGALKLPERCKSSLDRHDTPCQLRIAAPPPQPILLPARGEKEPRAALLNKRHALSFSRRICARDLPTTATHSVASQTKKRSPAPVGCTVPLG